MKKSLIVAAVVAACSLAQATTINWGLTAGSTLSEYAGGTAYLIWNSTTSEVLSYDGDLSKATEFSSSKIKDTIISSTTVGADGSIAGSELVTSSSATGLGTGNKPFYIAIISADGKSLTSLEATGSVNIRDTSFTATFQRAASAFSVSYTAPIPEPTTVALLALGLAALGLKRKVA